MLPNWPIWEDYCGLLRLKQEQCFLSLPQPKHQMKNNCPLCQVWRDGSMLLTLILCLTQRNFDMVDKPHGSMKRRKKEMSTNILVCPDMLHLLLPKLTAQNPLILMWLFQSILKAKVKSLFLMHASVIFLSLLMMYKITSRTIL